MARHGLGGGDLLLLLLKPGGVEHKHYNRYDETGLRDCVHQRALFEWGQ
jgi:hypothetical protein